MPEDRFKRYQDVGSDFLESARARAEEFLRELAKATESTQKQASGQVDELVAAGRRGTDQLLDAIRKEVSTQLSQLGIATKDDLEALERRLAGGGAAAPAAKTAPAAKKTTKKVTAKKAPAGKAVAKESPATKEAAEKGVAAKKAAPVKATTEKAPVKKAAAKKTAADRAAAKKAAPAKRAPGTNGGAGAPTGA